VQKELMGKQNKRYGKEGKAKHGKKMERHAI